MSLYIDELHRIFPYGPPQFLLDVPEDLVPKAFLRQGVEYAYGAPLSEGILRVNYVKLIKDITEIDKEREKPNYGLPPEEILRLSGIYMRTEFYEWIGDVNRSDIQKFYKCHYYKMLLFSFKSMHNQDYINTHDDFFKVLCELEYYYSKLSSQSNIPASANKNQIELRFKEVLSVRQQTEIEAWVNEHEYTDDPKLLVQYLIGKNRGEGFRVMPGKEDETCYFLQLLYLSKLIKLTVGKGYLQYVEMTLCPFSQEKEKCQIKNRVRKFERNKLLKSSIGKGLNDFVRKISK